MFSLQDLCREIGSQASTVRICIRASTTAEQSHKSKPSGGGNKQPSAEEELENCSQAAAAVQLESTAANVNRNKTESNLKGLEQRYLNLYLSAIEVQLLLEQQLKHSTPVSIFSIALTRFVCLYGVLGGH